LEQAATSRPTHAIIFTSHQVEPSAKNPFARAIGYDTDVKIFFEKIIKWKEGIVPWVAPERGAFQHGCRDAHRSAFREVATYRNIENEKFFELMDI
jgi:hypothetical protein